MNAPLDPRIQRNRERRARRFVDYFLGQMRGSGVLNAEADKAALQAALGQVRAASKEQWAQVAEKMNERSGVPSGETFLLIVAEFERLVANADAQADYQKRQAAEDSEIFKELLQQRSDPEVLDAVSGTRRR
jgi:hypothetical protein